MKLLSTIACFYLLIQSPLLSQSIAIRGSVRDVTTNEPLVYANIQIDGTSQGVSTNETGQFELSLAPGEYRIRSTYVGYKTDTITVNALHDLTLMIRLYAVDVLLQGVTVYAHYRAEASEKEVSALTLQSERIREITSAIPDVLRSIQMLPGVSTNNEFSAKYNVRGGNQDENLVLVNSTKVYDPFHMKEASNASIGIFNVDMISTMDLMTGGFPARFGDRMSSVLDIKYREGNKDKVEGKGSIGFTNLDALLEGPLGDGGSFIVGARKSYLEYVMKMIEVEPTVHPSFYDVQGVFSHSLSPASKILFKFIHSGDDFTDDPHVNIFGPNRLRSYGSGGAIYDRTWVSADSTHQLAAYSNTMLAVEHVSVLSSAAIVRSEISMYDQRDSEHSWDSRVYDSRISGADTLFYQSSSQWLRDNTLRIRTWEVSFTLDLQHTSRYSTKTGVSYQYLTYDQNQNNEQIIYEFTNAYHHPDTTLSNRVVNPTDEVNGQVQARSYKVAAFLENMVQLTDQAILNVGGRLDYFDFNKDLTWSPRINVSYRTDLGLTFRGGWGHYYQSPIYSQLASSVTSDTNTQSQRAIQYVAGIDYDLVIDLEKQQLFKFKAEVYHKDYDRLINATITSSGVVYYSRRNDAEGRANGLDVYLAYSRRGFYGWISYSYLIAEQRLLSNPDNWYPRYTDQRHTLAVVSDVDLGAGWSLNARFAYGSGYAYTPSVARYDASKGIWQWIPGNPNSGSLPSYSRIDFRVTKLFHVFGVPASAYVDVNNLLNWKNVQSYRYQFDSQGQPRIQTVYLWPIIPTFGVSVMF